MIRVRGRRPLFVVIALLGALIFWARPAGAVGVPAGPGPGPAGVWPLQPAHQVVRAFDPPTTRFGAGHRGVDLAGSVGEAVQTALPGRVAYAGRLAGRGVVVVDHGATRTTYEPVAASVHRGDLVARGQRLGTLELAGSHCFPGACLHWGWKRGPVYLDPLLLVGGGPIVLLPLWAGQPLPGVTPAPSLPWPPLTLPGPPVGSPYAPVWRRPLAMHQVLI
jgi:murein DD-endopeptidase MepM/ murein hydrolase activator NlpD